MVVNVGGCLSRFDCSSNIDVIPIYFNNVVMKL